MIKTWNSNQVKWIWLPGDEKPANAYVQFRKTFQLGSIPDKATVHISADCKYLLFINGEVVGRGPVTTDPKYKQVDVYDIKQMLRKGGNTVAALVLHRQNRTSRLYPVRGGFLFQLDSGNICLGTDNTWKARLAEEYKSDTPYMTHQYGQQEWVDGRKIPVVWESTDFDDSYWIDAVEIKNPERCWSEKLELRTVPHMRRKIIHPEKLVSYFGLTTHGKPPEKDYEPAKEMMMAYPMSSIVAWNKENIVHPENGPAVFMERYGDGIGIVVDLGEEMFGYPFMDVECPAGVVVNIGHGEVLSRNRIQTVLMAESSAEQRYADRYVTREGRQRFEIFDSKGCRYLEFHFARIHKGTKLIIHKVGLAKSEPPFERMSDFSCDDKLLNCIWEICRRTAEVKCQDWHICDAQREQNNWPEPFQDMLYFQVFGRVEMARQTIDIFCRAQLPGGLFLSTFPTIGDKPVNEFTENDMHFYIFGTFTLPTIIYLDWLYGGEDERQSFWLECCAISFESLVSRIGSHGTITNLPGDQWLEWSGLDARKASKSWEITAFNAWMVMNLELLSEMAEAYGKKEWADLWRHQARLLRKASDVRFWSEERKAYIDGVYDGEPSFTVSQSTNAMAVLAQLGKESRLRKALATTEDPKRCDVPSAINMMAMYHEALQSLGIDADVLDRIRRKWGYMLAHGATTTWESEEALERNMGLCFGFGGHPLNYLARTVLGITPLEPGHKKFSVQIVPQDLNHAKGRIATPRAYIEIAWKRNDERFDIHLTVPKGTQAHVAAPRYGKSNIPYLKIILDGVEQPLSIQKITLCTFLRAEVPSLVVGPGDHYIVFKR
jgi:hypothetical protein